MFEPENTFDPHLSKRKNSDQMERQQLYDCVDKKKHLRTSENGVIHLRHI